MSLEFTPSTVLENTSPVVTAVPISMAGWFNSDSVANTNSCIVSVGGDNGSERHEWELSRNRDDLYALTADAGGFSLATTTGGFLVDTWNHGCAVFAANNDRRAYLNGGNKGTESTARTPNPAYIDRNRIAQRRLDDWPWDGELAEVGIWNIALTDDDVYSLSRGFSPLLIKPDNLVLYFPMIRGVYKDLVAGLTFTKAGAGVTVSPHCRVLYPR